MSYSPTNKGERLMHGRTACGHRADSQAILWRCLRDRICLDVLIELRPVTHTEGRTHGHSIYRAPA